MRIWLQRSSKDGNSVFAAAERGDVSVFADLRADGRALLHAISVVCAAAAYCRARGRKRKRSAVPRRR